MEKFLRILKGVGLAVLAVTWCVLQSLAGALLTLALVPFSKREIYRGMVTVYHRFSFSFSLGFFAFVSHRADGAKGVRSHLYGHFLQSCILGPFFLFTVSLCQLIVRIPPLKRHRLERGKTVDDTIVEKTAETLARRFGE